MGFPRQEYWSELPFPSPGALPNLGTEPMSLCIVGRFFTDWATREAGSIVCFSSDQLLSYVWLFATPWTAARQASLSITNSQSLLKLMSIESVMPSNHLILCHPLLLLPSIFPNIRIFSNESVLPIMWPKYWSFSFSVSPSSEYSGLISFRKSYAYILFNKMISAMCFSRTISLGLVHLGLFTKSVNIFDLRQWFWKVFFFF